MNKNSFFLKAFARGGRVCPAPRFNAGTIPVFYFLRKYDKMMQNASPEKTF